jgi:DNA-directed RNA polymerase subunit RPC12/RpoP
MPFMVDIRCGKCGFIRTVMLKSSESKPDQEDAKCPQCGSKKFDRMLGGNFGAYESSDRETRSAILKKRSEDHSRAAFKDNFERERSRVLKK